MALETYTSAYTKDQLDKMINFPSNIVAGDFDSAATYVYGDYVIYNSLLYMCISNSSVTGDWDSTKWEQHRVFDNTYAILNSGTSSNV